MTLIESFRKELDRINRTGAVSVPSRGHKWTRTYDHETVRAHKMGIIREISRLSEKEA